MEFKAYIIPSVKREDSVETLVLRTRTVASMFVGSSLSPVGYLLEGERKRIPKKGFLGGVFGKINYESVQDFYDSVKNTFDSNSTVSESKVEEFAKQNGLVPTKLLFY